MAARNAAAMAARKREAEHPSMGSGPSEPHTNPTTAYAAPPLVVAVPVGYPDVNTANEVQPPRQNLSRRPRNWDTHLCECFNVCVPSCMMAWCCPCFVVARVRTSAGIDEPCKGCVGDKFCPNVVFLCVPGFLYVVANVMWAVPLIGPLVTLVTFFFCIYMIYFIIETRIRFREKHNIRHPHGYCCCSCCCDCLSVYQAPTRSFLLNLTGPPIRPLPPTT
mmetsp:Transcript_19280/g.37233  ORF Transcript_19280/g.37233 Transcript_19280/m.37233 type:complete len:220 (+) Transcript_19280:53-712(+)